MESKTGKPPHIGEGTPCRLNTVFHAVMYYEPGGVAAFVLCSRGPERKSGGQADRRRWVCRSVGWNGDFVLL